MENNKNSIYKVIKPIYLFCKIFGAFPYTLINSINTKEQNVQFKLFICLKLQKKDYIFIGIQVTSILLTVLCFVFEMLPDIHQSIYMKEENIIDSITYIIQLTGLYFLIISNILVVYLNKKNIENIFDNIYKTDYYLQELNFPVDHIKTIKFGKKLLIATVMNCILVTIPDLKVIFTEFIPYNYLFAELGSVGLNSFFAILCFDARQKFFLIKEAIIDLHFQIKNQKLSLTNVTQILKIYRQLTEHCTLLNSAMNIVLLANVFNAFLAFTLSIYYSFFNFIDLYSKGMYEVLNVFYASLYWNIYNMCLLLIEIFSFNGIVKQVILYF